MSSNLRTPEKNRVGDHIQQNQAMSNNNDGQNAFERRGTQSELRNQIDRKLSIQSSQHDQRKINALKWKFLQIIIIFTSLLFGLGCLTLYPRLHSQNKLAFYLVIAFMAISISCFVLSLILILIFHFLGKCCRPKEKQQQQANQHLIPQSSVRDHFMPDDGLYKSQLDSPHSPQGNKSNRGTLQLDHKYQSIEMHTIQSDHSIQEFRVVDYGEDQVPWCNVGWFPLIYYSVLYIAYLFYLIFSISVITNSWKEIPMMVSIFLIYMWIVALSHVATAVFLLFRRKFISQHIEEMEDIEVYQVDEEEIKKKKAEILEARNQDIKNNNFY